MLELDEVTKENVMEERWLEGMVHDGVRCSGCHTTPIEGKRLECEQCYDYNLCEECWTATARKKKLQPSLSIPAPNTTLQQSVNIELVIYKLIQKN